MTPAKTLVSLLATNARVDQYIGYLEADQVERRVSYAELEQRALGILWHLQQLGARRGDHLIIFLNNNEAFIDGFWGALAGGIIPVPLAVGISDEHRLKLLRVARQLGQPYLYTDRKSLDRLLAFASESGAAELGRQLAERAFVIDELTEISRRADPVDARPDDTAFIQYSSGSTSAPKGVVLSHANILANTHGATVATGYRPGDVSLSWMPLTHDMGLIGMFIFMFASQMQVNLMPTELFVRRPLLWTSFLSRKKVTITASPNFGYRHYLKVLGERPLEAMDLSAVRVIYNGAEPISISLCDEFMDRLAPAGLARNSMFTVYGLAEASLAMTIPAPGAPYRSIHLDRHALTVGTATQAVAAGTADALELALLGRVIPHAELRIVDDDDRPVAADVVGHVQIRGDNVTCGYFKLPEINATSFTAGGWLRTGDLGLMHEAQLVITGRAKELIIINGQNYYPHDIESIAESVDGLELGKVVATGCRPEGAETDQLTIFVLHRGSIEDFLPLARDVARRVNEHSGLEVTRVVPVKRIPKTTSGKVQRTALAASLMAGEFDAELAAIAELQQASGEVVAVPVASIERQLLDIVREAMPGKRVDAEDNLFDVGANSLALIQIHEQIDQEFPGQVELAELFDYPTVRQLAGYLEKKAATWA